MIESGDEHMRVVSGQTFRSLVLAAALVSVPAAAYAANVSSNEGAGFQVRTSSYSNGAKTGGQLHSTHGYAVYYWGKVNWSQWFCSSNDVGRYTSDTTSLSDVTRFGVISYSPSGICTSSSVQAKIARNVNNAPDPAGSWSANF